MRTLPPPTRSLVIVRQLNMPLDTQKLIGLSSSQRNDRDRPTSEPADGGRRRRNGGERR